MRSLTVVGLSHNSAPIEMREKLVFSPDEIARIFSELQPKIIEDGLILSTCNRTELYYLPADSEITHDYLIDFLLRHKHLDDRTSLRSIFEVRSHCDALIHLFRVVAGIDSQVLGDQQIFSQVKEAFRQSQSSNEHGGYFTKLAHAAFRVAKRAKSETHIGEGAATISYAAVEFTRKIYDDLKEREALVIGMGDSAKLAVKYLFERGIRKLYVANRTSETASQFAREFPSGRVEVCSLNELPQQISQVDIVISSTASPNYIITKDDIEVALRKRSRNSPLVFIDIAVPRDIDPEVGTLPNVFLKDIDDLRSIVDQNLERRKLEIPKVEAIVTEELEQFLALESRLEIGPTIKDLRDKFEQVRKNEIERNASRLDERTLQLVDDMTRRIINRLLHTPTIMLKEPHGSLEDMLTKVELLRELFALNRHSDLGEDNEA